MQAQPGQGRRWIVLCGLLMAALCNACAHSGHGGDLRQAARLPQRVDINSVPFFPQEAYQCGPAAMAMVLAWSGLDVAKEDLVATVYTPARQGSLQPGLIAAARRHGRLALPFNGPSTLLDEIAAGHPVIVLQNLGAWFYPVWHYAVVVGIDRPADRIILHTGTSAYRSMDWSRFLFTWERGDYWGLAVLPPGRLPAGDDPSAYIQAVLGLEQAGQWKAAAAAYAAARERWPSNARVLIGLGNSHVMLGDMPSAERALRRAASLDFGNADTANNLAHVLALRGKLDEALRWSRRAVQKGGANASVYEQTLREIEALREQEGHPAP